MTDDQVKEVQQGMEVINLDDTTKTVADEPAVGEGSPSLRARLGDAGENAREIFRNVSEKIGAGYNVVAERAVAGVSDTRAYAGEKLSQGGEVVKNVYDGTTQRIGDTYEATKKVVGETVAPIGERITSAKDVVKEKAAPVAAKIGEKYEGAKENTKAVAKKAAEKTVEAWEAGKGQVIRVKDVVGESASKVKESVKEGGKALWQGNAAATLAREKNAQEFKDLKVQGAEELDISRRSRHTQACIVPPNKSLKWLFRVKEHDVGFSVAERVQVFGGSEEQEILKMERYDCTETAKGQWTNTGDTERTLVLVFDNTYSKLRSKTVAYLYGLQPASTTVPLTPQPPAADDGQDSLTKTEA